MRCALWVALVVGCGSSPADPFVGVPDAGAEETAAENGRQLREQEDGQAEPAPISDAGSGEWIDGGGDAGSWQPTMFASACVVVGVGETLDCASLCGQRAAAISDRFVLSDPNTCPDALLFVPSEADPVPEYCEAATDPCSCLGFAGLANETGRQASCDLHPAEDIAAKCLCTGSEWRY